MHNSLPVCHIAVLPALEARIFNCIQGIIVQDGNQKTVICLQTEVLKSMKIELALTDGPNNSLHFQTGATLPHLLSSSTVVLQQHIAEVVESGGVGLQNGGKGWIKRCKCGWSQHSLFSVIKSFGVVCCLSRSSLRTHQWGCGF